MSPTKEEVAGAVERLECLASEHEEHGRRLKAENAQSIPAGHHLLIASDLRTLLQAYASETAAREAALEKAAQICEQQAREFADPAYAAGQPLGSFAERFACAVCAKAIRALKGEPSPTDKEPV